LLLILATARGAYVVLEQPASSVMKFMPDFVATAKLIQKHLGLWNEQFLFDTEISAILVYCIAFSSATHPFLPNIPATGTSLSWMASWGAPSAKPSRVWGTPLLA
jgi:hypothetical protein